MPQQLFLHHVPSSLVSRERHIIQMLNLSALHTEFMLIILEYLVVCIKSTASAEILYRTQYQLINYLNF